MYNKLWLVDGMVVIVGGCNFGDEYFNVKLEMNFIDFDLFGVGFIVNQFLYSFDQYWNSVISWLIEDFFWCVFYFGELELV